MVRVFALVRETMASHAVCFLNMGDTYSSKPAGCAGVSHSSTLNGNSSDVYRVTLEQSVGQKRDTTSVVDAGNLCLIPQRLAIALQSDGWYVRSIVAWTKPAPMPASVQGWSWRRCRVNQGGHQLRGDVQRNVPGVHASPSTPSNARWTDCPGCKRCEPNGGYVLRRGSWRPTSSWEPILMLAKSDRYFCDGEAVKQPSAAATVSRNQYTRVIDDPDEQYAVKHDHETVSDGANLRDVWRVPLEEMSREDLIGFIQSMDDGSLPDAWRIASEPLRDAHYAAFPTELVRRCLKAGTSARGYCPSCSAPWVRIIESKPMVISRSEWAIDSGNRTAPSGHMDSPAETKTLGWRPSCLCPEQEPRPGLVLDPFAGSGRTGITAQRLGLDYVGVELNPNYAEMARRLLKEESPLFS